MVLLFAIKFISASFTHPITCVLAFFLLFGQREDSPRVDKSNKRSLNPPWDFVHSAGPSALESIQRPSRKTHQKKSLLPAFLENSSLSSRVIKKNTRAPHRKEEIKRVCPSLKLHGAQENMVFFETSYFLLVVHTTYSCVKHQEVSVSEATISSCDLSTITLEACPTRV